jgi:hypothetical protein
MSGRKWVSHQEATGIITGKQRDIYVWTCYLLLKLFEGSNQIFFDI